MSLLSLLVLVGLRCSAFLFWPQSSCAAPAWISTGHHQSEALTLWKSLLAAPWEYRCITVIQLMRQADRHARTKRLTDPVHQAASAAVSQRDCQLLSKKKRCQNLHLLQSWCELGTRPVLEGGSFHKVEQNDGGVEGAAHSVMHVMLWLLWIVIEDR